MKEFSFKGEDGKITMSLDPEKITGDQAFHGKIEVKAGNYHVKSNLYISVSELNRLFTDLNRLLESRKGALVFTNHINERNIECNLSFDPDGKGMIVQGVFVESPERKNELFFKIKSDPKTIHNTLKELESIIKKFDVARKDKSF